MSKYAGTPARKRGIGFLLGTILAGFLATSCGGSSSGAVVPVPPPSATALEQFDFVWDDFDRNYSFFDLKSFDWNDSRARFRTQISTNSTDVELFSVFSAMFLELQDGHVRLQTPVGNSTYTGWFDQFPVNFDASIITASYLGASAMMSPQASMLFGRINADIGYVRVHSLSGSGHGGDMDFILSQLSGISALVVDLRSNGGGNDQNGEAIAGRFVDSPRVYRRVRFRDGPLHTDFGPFIDVMVSPAGTQTFQGPVAVLTNRSTFSSAESMVLAFATLPNAVRVGDFSGGGSANPELRTLSNGWQYTVSRWIEFFPGGSTFEGVGIAPDIRVDIDPNDAAALRDTIMDSAILELQIRLAL